MITFLCPCCGEITVYNPHRLVSFAKDVEINTEGVAQIVCKYFDIHFRSLLSKNRTRSIVDARYAYFYLAAKYTTASNNSIAKLLNKDHTTVGRGLTVVQNLIDTGDAFGAHISELTKIIEAQKQKPVKKAA